MTDRMKGTRQRPRMAGSSMINRMTLASVYLILALLIPADRAFPAASINDRLEAALAARSSPEVMKIVREIADEIMKAPVGQAQPLAVVIGLFRKAEALDPESLTADDAGRLGRMYLMLSESYADVAKRYLTRALENRERESDRVALGNALLYMGDASGARREYLKVTETKPDESVVSVNLSLAERALGDTSSALARLKRIQARNVNAAVTRAASLSIADIEYASGNLAGAKAQVERILLSNPGDVEALRALKQIYVREGRPDLANELDKRLGGGDRGTDPKSGPTIKGDRRK